MELSYLLAFPDASEEKAPALERFKGLKDAPYFQPIDIELVTLGEETAVIEGYAVRMTRQRYDGRVQMAECRFDLKDPFAVSVLQERLKIQIALQNRCIPVEYRRNGLYEEYSILLVEQARPTPDKWIDKNERNLANFMRSQREVFDPGEIKDILISRTRYSAEELTLVDWEAAVIISPDGDFQSDIALLKIGNYQLLRYRMLDQSLESMLDRISDEFLENRKRPLRPGPTRGTVRQIIRHRLEVMLDFERTEQNLLLIGDWYTAKLYEAIRAEFYLEDWKSAVSDKLDNLESIIGTIQENFSLSWSGLMERVELAGWVILLIGYFILFFMDLGLTK
jgi:hypothetical protein